MKTKRFIVKSINRQAGLVRDHIMLVDEEDAHIVRGSYWSVQNAGNKSNRSYVGRRKADGSMEWLHYVVMKASKTDRVYHVNKDSLDNRKANLLRSQDRVQELED